MKRITLVAMVLLLAGCGDPNYVEPIQTKGLGGRPIPDSVVFDNVSSNY